jgi:hypothetical protein
LAPVAEIATGSPHYAIAPAIHDDVLVERGGIPGAANRAPGMRRAVGRAGMLDKLTTPAVRLMLRIAGAPQALVSAKME